MRVEVHQLVLLLDERKSGCELVLDMRDRVLALLSRFDFDAVLELGVFDSLLALVNQLVAFYKHLLSPNLLRPNLISDLLLLRFLFLNLLEQLV
jgi:hypothetical protein